MAAYAALVSVMHIIDQINHHPRPPISFDKIQVESLTEKVTFLQEFLEGYLPVASYSNETDPLESRIADAAYAAEDVIESHIVDQIHAGSTSNHNEKISSTDFYQELQKVIEDMDLIKKEVMEINKEKMGVEHQLQRNSTPAASLRSSSTAQKSTMVGFDDVLLEIMDKLTGGQLDRRFIPIVGMGGIGKTTLARSIYQSQVVVQHFDILVWVTISQEYKMREILLELLQEGGGNLSQIDEYELGEKLHKKLSGRRYLIIMDDIWDSEVWDHLKFFFPDNNNGSRVMLTTRLSNLAFLVADSYGIEMGFLDENNSWNLFCKNVFGEEDCPLELKEIGKKIIKNCNGLPLSIIVIGGLLAKSERTQQYWEYIAENLNSIVNLEDNERCLQILYMSYKILPVCLKPCFLYMGVFLEDDVICVSILLKLWVAEGFLKPICGKSLEEVAEEYLKELVDRNLILVEAWSTGGRIKFCKIHDLLRDLCLREARKQKFLCVAREHSQGIHTERRIGIPRLRSEKVLPPQVLHALESASLVRSLVSESHYHQLLLPFRLLRICVGVDTVSLETIFQQVNLRSIIVTTSLSGFPSSVSLLWNLQMLFVDKNSEVVDAPSEIWKMPHLRHVLINGLRLPDPPTGHMDGRDDIVLENLRSIESFKCGDEVVKRIPNVKTLKVYYAEFWYASYGPSSFEEGYPDYCLKNLGHLHKLESLLVGCDCYPKNMSSHLVRNITFPRSLTKLNLDGTHLQWEDLTMKVGSLPNLQVLKLLRKSVNGLRWKTVEGQFCSLKFLKIYYCNLIHWTTENTHFPRLEHLVLEGLKKLEEIPSSIGDILTLQAIKLLYCSDSAVDSAKRILLEQEELGNVSLQVQIHPT